jgi:shikimate 5-dehydrogenase/shikimate kinase
VTTLLIGHRGTGKSSFLRSLKDYAGDRGIRAAFYDLDREIENYSGKSVADLFNEGEPAFRLAEKKTFAALLDRGEPQKYIALGAGFEGPLPADAHVVWIRRETDAAGRIFLDRPRLDRELSPLDEFRNRYNVREHHFKAWAHEQLILPEGYERGLEDFILGAHGWHLPFDFTLLPSHFRDWEGFWEKRSTWGQRRIELREDLLSPAQIERARESLPKEKVLSSVRKAGKIPAGAVDWALELGTPPGYVDILSRHEREGSLQTTLKNFGTQKAGVLKLAIEIQNFTELEMGHDWWLKDPEKRAFLPRSADGRWRWYRSLFGPRMPVHFYREDEGSAPDQPLLWQTRLQPPLETNFAAVLGRPVRHSRSPLEHLEFFRERKMPFVAIDVREEEFSHALDFLARIGLSHAAVTAPLKKAAFSVCTKLSPEAEELRAVNTLRLSGPAIEGHNTDVLALKELASEFKGEVWLWGGGGVRSSVRKAFPQVKEFSARTGLPHPGSSGFNAPAVLMWAAGRSNEFMWPPESVKTGRVLDLNYADDSPGLEWAARMNLPYQSGLKMFKLQAEFQRRFWSSSK